MLDKIRQSVRTRHKLRLRWGILLRNTEDDRSEFWYTNVPPSPWMNKLSECKAWLEAMEETRLQGHVQRPNTKWVFERAVSVDLKAILDRQPLQIGRGRLPDWLRNKHEVISLDNYEDYLCLFRSATRAKFLCCSPKPSPVTPGEHGKQGCATPHCCGQVVLGRETFPTGHRSLHCHASWRLLFLPTRLRTTTRLACQQ